MIIAGVPAVMDFSKCTTREAILSEAKRQNEFGLRYAEYSYVTRNMIPTVNECLKIVYEHVIVFPGNMPDGFEISMISDAYTGMPGLYQIIISETDERSPIMMTAAYQGTRYRTESGQRMLDLFLTALDELLMC